MANRPRPDVFRIPIPPIPIPGLSGVSIGGNLTIDVQPNGGVTIPTWGVTIRFGSAPPTDVPQPPPPDPRLNPPDPIPFPFPVGTHDDHDDGVTHDDHDDQPHDDHDDGVHDDHDDQPHDDHDDQPHDDHDDQPHDDHDDQPHDDHDDQPHDDHDDHPHDDHDDQPHDDHDDHDDQFADDGSDDDFEAVDDLVLDDIEDSALAPGAHQMTVQNVQIPNAPPGAYFAGTFTANVAADGTTTISNWNVTLNFSWPGGGTSSIPAPH